MTRLQGLPTPKVFLPIVPPQRITILVTRIKDLLARINEAIKTCPWTFRRDIKKEVFNSTNEIEDLLMVNPSIAPPTISLIKYTFSTMLRSPVRKTNTPNTSQSQLSHLRQS
ncbi:hypothetical protein ABMA28_002450 [Loxostege sticticalis]|uniref:Uncharacterized protein n=1 Tax=Loxostege sticticalis TaxID=481309 RepID=A0ABD0SWW0_LOXSC